MTSNKHHFEQMVCTFGSIIPHEVSYQIVARDCSTQALFQAHEQTLEETRAIAQLVDTLLHDPDPAPVRDSLGKYYYAFPLITGRGEFEHILLCYGYGDMVEAARYVCSYAAQEYKACFSSSRQLVVISMLNRLDDSPAVRVFLYEGAAQDEAGMRDALREVVTRNYDGMMEHVCGWEDFFRKCRKELAEAGFSEITANEVVCKTVKITRCIYMSLHCNENILDLH